MTMKNLSLSVLLATAAAVAVGSAALAQTGPTQFRDAKTGKVWTPENVGKDNQLRPANEPTSPADKAFDPKSQVASAPPIVIQRPAATIMGSVPITAGPTVPIVVAETPTLQAIPGDRWIAALYITNNSGAPADSQVGCTFTNNGNSVQETRVIVPTAGPGQRLGLPVYGPRTDTFVDRVLCRVLTP
ncbi:hypothetical protein [Reyranella sp.]|uniref:hypothetical protein n=1 Tax=Reyranella sp. TaxID=1929291 RepID=UPI003BA8E40A